MVGSPYRFPYRAELLRRRLVGSLCRLLPGRWFLAVLALQAGFGLAQAGIFPCSAGMIRHWIPSTQWAFSVGLMGGFMSIGGAIGSAITGYAIEGIETSWLTIPPLSWRWVFVGFSVPGFLFAAWFFHWYRNRPEIHSGVNDAERELIRRRARRRHEPRPEPTGFCLSCWPMP